MPQNNCNACDAALSNRSPGLECSFCRLFYHIKCVNISKSEFDVLSKVDVCNWRCTQCANKSLSTESLKKAIDTLQQAVNVLQQQILQLQEDRKNDTNQGNCESIIAEISERQKRGRNVILFNLPSNSHSTDEE